MKVLSVEHLATAARREALPPEELPEVAFLGRSNVGKSSLLNRLAGRRRLARTSATPGQTRLIHFYRLERRTGALVFADLPGYGWAKVSKAERLRWRRLVEGYLEGRGSLRAAVLLQDLRRQFSVDERELLAWLDQRRIPAVVVLTKADKLKPMRRQERIRQLRGDIEGSSDCLVATSSQTGAGIRELWRTIDRLLGIAPGIHPR